MATNPPRKLHHYSVVGTADTSRVDTSRTSLSREPVDKFPIWRSLSTIHSGIPNSVLSLDVVSAAGLQIIRPETHPEAFVPLPPDGGWGWFVVFAAFCANLIIDGICVSFGILATELVDHFETSMAAVMLAGSLMVGCYQIIGPVAAGLVNKFGCRVVGFTGALLAAFGMFLSAFMENIGAMFFTYGIISGIAFGLIHLPSIICVSFYFDTKRALAIGLTVTGTPVGAMVFAPLTELLLKHYGWSNTLIIFAGLLLNGCVLAAFYRPLVPALLLKPLTNNVNAEVVMSMLQMAENEHAENEEAKTRAKGLQDQPIVEEDEGETEVTGEVEKKEDMKGEKEGSHVKDANTPSDGVKAPGDEDTTGRQEEEKLLPKIHVDAADAEKGKADQENPTFSRHPQTLQQILDSFSWWRERIRAKRKHMENKRRKHLAASARLDSAIEETEVEAHRSSCLSDEGDGSSDEDSWHSEPDDGERGVPCTKPKRQGKPRGASVAVCPILDKGANGDPKNPRSQTDEENASEARDQLHPLLPTQGRRQRTTTVFVASRPKLPPEIVITGQNDRRKYSKADGRKLAAPTSDDCILSTPNLGIGSSATRTQDWLKEKSKLRTHASVTSTNRPQRLSEARNSRVFQDPTSTSVLHLAHIVPSRRTSVGFRPTSVVGSQFFGIHQSNASAVGNLTPDKSKDPESPMHQGSITDLELAEPVIVELPHESVTVEDYARPMYRKDIFYHGSVLRQQRLENAIASMGSTQDFVSSDGLGKREISVISAGPSNLFGSNILFGEHMPLPPNLNAVLTEDDANWTGSCIMSLTKIPLPETAQTPEEDDDDNAAFWDRLRQETGLYVSDTPADGIYRVPRSETLCCWWLCWKPRRISRMPEGEQEAAKNNKLHVRTMHVKSSEGEKALARPKKPYKVKQHSVKLVFQQKCYFMPKSMWDIITTMMDISLLKNKSFLFVLIGSFIVALGAYVPMFFVCDLATVFGIPQSKSSLFLTIYGGASIVSRLLFAWLAGRPNTSPLLMTICTMMVCGVAICFFPLLPSFWGQTAVMIIFGFTLSPHFSLLTTVLCDIIDLERLTNAYGVVAMFRGVSCTVGPPLASMIVSATGTYLGAFLAAASTFIVGSLLYTVSACLERIRLKKLSADADEEV